MRQNFSDILKSKKIMVIDGAMATELEAMGCNLNDELWSAKIIAEKPELIKKVHLSYFEAGADCGTSASYQATVDGFIKKGYTEKEAEKLIENSVKLLIEARNEYLENNKSTKSIIVCAAVGPYGAYLADGSEYRGNYGVGKEFLKKFHKRRIEILWNAKADILAVETIPSLKEAVAVAEIVEYIKAECWISFSCKNNTDISDGTKIKDCAKELNNFECVKAIGVNCTAPHFVSSLIKEIKSVSDKPVVVYPNSGEVYDAVTKTWHGSSDGKTYKEWAKEWLESGANLIGGCCRTTPDDIRQVKEAIYEKLK